VDEDMEVGPPTLSVPRASSRQKRSPRSPRGVATVPAHAAAAAAAAAAEAEPLSLRLGAGWTFAPTDVASAPSPPPWVPVSLRVVAVETPEGREGAVLVPMSVPASAFCKAMGDFSA
jgi:hypothetical protein